MYPAIGDFDWDKIKKENFKTPTWIVCGEKDAAYVHFSRMLHRKLKVIDNEVHYREIPGGNHNSPCEKIEWGKALSFVEGANSKTESPKSEQAVPMDPR